LGKERLSMLFLVVALLLLGILVGAAAYLPWPVAVVLGAGILLWLLVFTTRERKRRNARRA
jgi:4-amino-4-deoxy-L-arabinose transferase-like glycosyltransferase